MTSLGAPMVSGQVHAEPLAEHHRERLKAACAEDRDIWDIYPSDYGPDGFDANFDELLAKSDWESFALFDGQELVGMSSFIGIDPASDCVEIGATYYRLAWRGTGFNRTVKDMMIRRARDCGIRWIGFKVDDRNKRSQAAVLKLGANYVRTNPKDRTTWTGHVRDTAIFRLDSEAWEG